MQQKNKSRSSSPSPTKKIKTDVPIMPIKPLHLQVLKTYKKARASILTLPHGPVKTPVYMPVGTKGTIKGLTPLEMKELDCHILLGNTYHLASHPTGDLMESFGGLHKYMNWDRNILTDSGGFQMVSLSKLCEISEKGVEFENPDDGRKMFLRPEDSIGIQQQIGADIIMALDDVVKTTTKGERMGEACDRTLRWIQRCKDAHKNTNTQNLFGIVQGGLDFELRRKCVEGMVQMDLPGYAIGGMAGGESKEDFWKIVNLCTDLLPKDKPRYLMGVGYPIDLVVCSCLGVDMYDCVFSTRTARFGTVFTKHGFLKLKNAENAKDFRPIDEDCACSTCKNYTRAFLHTVILKEEVAANFLTTHNLNYLLTLMKNFRKAILDDCLEDFVNEFFKNQFAEEKVIPDWIKNAMKAAGINLYVYK